jgi:type IV pilus assembly protein PilA
MLQSLRKRLARSEEGFTLIELMVVVLIIAILLAIAIPTFLGARSRAQDRAAQSNLRNALTTEKTYYTDAQVYSKTITDMTAIEPNLVFHATDPKLGIVLQQPATDTGIVCLTRTSASGSVFSIWESAAAGTWYGKTTLAAAADCTTPAHPVDASYKQTGW